MTKNSLICKFILDHKNSWKEDLLNDFSITSKIIEDNNNTDHTLAIFNYGIGSDFNIPIVKEARGIIINIDLLEVVCWPFTKFGKYDNDYADNIDWSSAKVQEKIDGSIIKLWYDKTTKEWVFSTNGMIYAKEAEISSELYSKSSFLDLIEKAWPFTELDPGKIGIFSKDKTYMFELTTPENQVVIKHDLYKMWHIGTRSNINGDEFNDDIGIDKPKEYPISSLEECINAAEKLNRDETGNQISSCQIEGFVVVDANWNRIKVKSPIYSVLHNISSNGDMSKSSLIKMIDENLINIENVTKDFPDLAHYILYYKYKYDEVIYQMTAFLNICKKVYEMTDRKTLAMRISKHKYSAIAFKGLTNDKSVREILDGFTGGYLKTLCKYIPNYEPENYSFIFKKCDKELD